MTLVLSNENKDTLKKDEELWEKNRYLIRSITHNTGNYEEKYMKTKFKSDHDLPSE